MTPELWHSETGERIKKLKDYLKNEENFLLTYGDGVSNINIKKLIKFHLKHKKIATMTAVRPPVKFGELTVGKNNKVKKFLEKPQLNRGWINGGFFVIHKDAIIDALCEEINIRLAEQMKKEAKARKKRPSVAPGVPKDSIYRSLVTPAGWAFLIWPVIYLAESVFTAAQAFDDLTCDPQHGFGIALDQLFEYIAGDAYERGIAQGECVRGMRLCRDQRDFADGFPGAALAQQ